MQKKKKKKKGTSLAYVTRESRGGLASDTLQPSSLPGAAVFSALILRLPWWVPCSPTLAAPTEGSSSSRKFPTASPASFHGSHGGWRAPCSCEPVTMASGL